MTTDQAKKEDGIRQPSLVDALIPLLFMILLLSTSIFLFGIDAATGPLQVALFMSAVVAAMVAHKNGHSWERLGEEIVKGISLAMSAIMILIMVGALIGVWNMSGTIATMVYYGVKYIDPSMFYFAAALLTGVVGIVTGSSWSTAATLGVAFIGMSAAIGANSAITAGAVISGAYFGDLMTPLSETTILTPQIVGSNVYAHIKNLSKTTVPSYLIALVIFFVIGRNVEMTASMDTAGVLQALESAYNISFWNLLPVFVLLALGIKKYPAFLSILIGALVGAMVAVVMQPQVLTTFANDPSLSYGMAALKAVWLAMANGFTASSGYEQIDALFSGGGMDSMLTTVWLILGAMSFGAMMDFGGFNNRLITPIVDRVKSTGGTIAVVMFSALGFNIVAGDQYIAIVLPARMFMLEFRKRNLHPETLATAVENSGTITSPLIPWNSCGAYMTATLGVSTFLYLPYCFFNFINFALGIIFGFTGVNVLKLPADGSLPGEPLAAVPMVVQDK